LGKILVVDDEPSQLKLTRIRLEDAGYAVETASSAEEALSKIELDQPVAIASDVCMGEMDGFGLCRKVREDSRLAAVPVILLSAHCDEADYELATRVGAARLVARSDDFAAELAAIGASIARGHLASPTETDADLYERLLRRNANQISRLIGQAQSAEERYRTLFENANDAIAFLTPDGFVLEANARWHTLTGFAPADTVGRHIREFAAPGAEDANANDFHEALPGGRSKVVPIRRANGEVIMMEFSVSTTDVAGRPTVLAIGRDVTAEALARRELAAAEERYRTLVERIPDMIWRTDETGELHFVTANVERILGYSADEFRAIGFAQRMARVHPDDQPVMVRGVRSAFEHGTPFDVEVRVQRKDGAYIWVRNRSTATYVRDGLRIIEGMITDIDDRKVLEESLQQAQKMEAIGQLTGGIAHDFNNILAAILGCSHFLMDGLSEGDPRRADADQIRVAAERAASLTRQLLAFSRRQVLEPAVVDLNATVIGIEKMLRRLIGEDIALRVVPSSNLGAVRVDVGQIEQVIMNLVVNARDAMPTGGMLSIETANVELDADYAMGHPSVEPGPYVMLTVSDTGSGMDAETKRRLFEPFFTTKEVGKGTGLGLSTCYGIVKQSGGHIWVYSELGKGSVFKVYLPRVDATLERASVRAPASRLEGNETVLLVEDDARVRSAVKRMLEKRGYTVVAADDGTQAARVIDTYPGPIHAVLTDVVMPRASGPEVADFARARFGAKVLFMSGYTDHSMLRSGVVRVGQRFIQKPFSPDQLARKIREVLDA
jgi:PAS domain S-box-containing protein